MSGHRWRVLSNSAVRTYEAKIYINATKLDCYKVLQVVCWYLQIKPAKSRNQGFHLGDGCNMIHESILINSKSIGFFEIIY